MLLRRLVEVLCGEATRISCPVFSCYGNISNKIGPEKPHFRIGSTNVTKGGSRNGRGTTPSDTATADLRFLLNTQTYPQRFARSHVAAVNNISTFSGTRRCITVFTRARCQCKSSHQFSLRYILILLSYPRLRLPSGLFLLVSY